MSSDSKLSDAPPASLPWYRKLIYSMIVTAVFFVLVETLLAAFGVGRVLDTEDPYVGFDKRIPLMTVEVDEEGNKVVRTADNKTVWFNSQSFPLEKGASTKRIFCLGGSTTYGRPYNDLTSFCGWLREMLPVAVPDTDWQVINAGGISYASYRVASVMEELAEYEPDLFIVYTGHNEFLESRTYADMMDGQGGWVRSATTALGRTRTWSAIRKIVKTKSQAATPTDVLPGEVDEIMNHTVGPADYVRDVQWRGKVVHHFGVNLNRMVAIADKANAKLIFVVPASNEKDCSPFKSVWRDDLGEAEIARAEAHLDRAAELLNEAAIEPAMEELEAVLGIDPDHAYANYQLGRLLLGAGRHVEARAHLDSAIDQDICPLRAVDEIKAAISKVAEENDVPLLDFESLLKQAAVIERGHDFLGAEEFLDHVHPTIEAHQDLARALVDTMVEQQFLDDCRRLSESAVAKIDDHVRSQIDRHSQGVSLRNLAKVLHWAGKFEEAAPLAADALELIEGDLESQFVLADSLIQLGRVDEGMRRYESLFREGEFTRAYLPFGQLLIEYGDLEKAESYLSMAVVVDRDANRRAAAHVSLAELFLDRNDYEQARESLEIAERIRPGNVTTGMMLAEAQQGLGEDEAAMNSLYHVLETANPTRPDVSVVHYRLGLLLMKSKDYVAAINEFDNAIAADPNNAQAIASKTIAERLAE